MVGLVAISILNRSGIESPQGEVQHGGKTHPSKIGREQPRGGAAHGTKGEERRGNRQPKQDNLGEGHASPMQPEEQRRPRGVER